MNYPSIEKLVYNVIGIDSIKGVSIGKGCTEYIHPLKFQGVYQNIFIIKPLDGAQ
jgi:hypothetical protein